LSCGPGSGARHRNALGSAAAGASSPGNRSGCDGEIVVSATKVGEQSLSDVRWRSSFKGEALEKQGVREAKDLIELIPRRLRASEIGAATKVFSFGFGAGGPIGDG
jgi:hypothetical protein